MKELTAFMASGGARACQLLLKAWRRTQSTDGDIWQSATETSQLVRDGASITALRYLLGEGYAEARIETSQSDRAPRTFVECGARAFAPRSCIVLTPCGAAFASELAAVSTKKKTRADGGESAAGARPARQGNKLAKKSRQRRDLNTPDPSSMATPSMKAGKPDTTTKPVWNEAAGALRWRGESVLDLASQAATERALLRAFQQAGWRPVIENPLRGPDASHRRRNAVCELNKRQRPLRIQFLSLGGGRIGWLGLE